MQKKILIVDDDVFILKTICPKFQKNSYEVKLAKNVDEAITTLETYRPDIILLDIILPGESGIEILKRIKSKSETKSIPIVIFSNLSSEEEHEEAMKLGAIKYIVKADFTPDKVVEEIDNLLISIKK